MERAPTKLPEVTHSIRVGDLRFIHWAEINLAAITASGDSKRDAIACWDVPSQEGRGGRFLKFIGSRPFAKGVDSQDFMIIARAGQCYLQSIRSRAIEDKHREKEQ